MHEGALTCILSIMLSLTWRAGLERQAEVKGVLRQLPTHFALYHDNNTSERDIHFASLRGSGQSNCCMRLINCVVTDMARYPREASGDEGGASPASNALRPPPRQPLLVTRHIIRELAQQWSEQL